MCILKRKGGEEKLRFLSLKVVVHRNGKKVFPTTPTFYFSQTITLSILFVFLLCNKNMLFFFANQKVGYDWLLRSSWKCRTKEAGKIKLMHIGKLQEAVLLLLLAKLSPILRIYQGHFYSKRAKKQSCMARGKRLLRSSSSSYCEPLRIQSLCNVSLLVFQFCCSLFFLPLHLMIIIPPSPHSSVRN